jgi:16S rRNA (cytosine1402-N4)-methyltransferase
MATVSKISSLLSSSLATIISSKPKPKLIHHHHHINSFLLSASILRSFSSTAGGGGMRMTKTKKKTEAALAKEKRRTRSDKQLDEDTIVELYNNNSHLHIPVLLSEVLDVFSNSSLNSFVDCTLGAAGHSTNVSIINFSNYILFRDK